MISIVVILLYSIEALCFQKRSTVVVSSSLTEALYIYNLIYKKIEHTIQLIWKHKQIFSLNI